VADVPDQHALCALAPAMCLLLPSLIDFLTQGDNVLLETTRFGKINYKKQEIVWMTRGILGFEKFRRYVIISAEDQEPFKWLQSIDNGSLAFLIIDPLYFRPDYAVEVNPRDLTMLGAANFPDITIFVMVTIPPGHPEKMSANLQAPVALNRQTLLAAQLILGESAYSTRHSIFKDIEKKLASVPV